MNMKTFLHCGLAAVASCVLAAQAVFGDVTVSIQPPDLYFLPGGNATFTAVVSTSANETIRKYAWLFSTNAIPPTVPIPGATSSNLTLVNIQNSDVGQYYVEVFYDSGSLTNLSVEAGPAFLLPNNAPVITSVTNISGLEGLSFTFDVTASGSPPITFSAAGLPPGLSINPTNGVISGIPAALGDFTVTLSASNLVSVQTNLTISLGSDIPVIDSALSVTTQQGQDFSYTITASNDPTYFTAGALPPGLDFNPVTGVISGASLIAGDFSIAIGAGNEWGLSTNALQLTITSGAPRITSPLFYPGDENQNFSYQITASHNPTVFTATGLPPGLIVNTNTGFITGALLFGGTNSIVITAANAYGVASNLLTVAVNYAPLSGLAIVNVTNFYSKPYLLDFTFSLRDDPNAATNAAVGNAVVRPPEDLQVQCLEGDLQDSNAVPIADETSYIVNRAIDSKEFKTFFALDYTYSMFSTPNAIPDMQAAVENLINEQPATAQFGVVEFNADYETPQTVTGFTANKAQLGADIEGIQTNFVQGNYAGTRMYDAVAQALTNFNSTNINIENFVIVMSDGWDDSSVLETSTNFPTPVDVLVSMANSNQVKIYCVGFGPDPNTNVLETLAGSTGGRYYAAATPADVAAQFAQLLKDLNSEYILRWATLQRGNIGFQPMFRVTVDGQTADFNTQFTLIANPPIVDTNTTPPTTNITYTNISAVPFYVPSQWAGDVRMGALTLTADAETNITDVTLAATYVPRFTREIRLHYRANYPCYPLLLQTGPNQLMNGWSLSQTNDGGGGTWLTLASPEPTNALSSLRYGAMSDLVQFQFQNDAVPQANLAFSFINVDNSIYSNAPPSPEGFTLSNAPAFSSNYAALPPFATPLPWLQSYGFTDTNDLADLEQTSPNGTGFTLWEDYIAGLNPKDTNSIFGIQQFQGPQAGGPPTITFNSVQGRVYRVDASTPLGDWVVLQDNIQGTGGPITIEDNRNLIGVSSGFYRVVVRYPQ